MISGHRQTSATTKDFPNRILGEGPYGDLILFPIYGSKNVRNCIKLLLFLMEIKSVISRQWISEFVLRVRPTGLIKKNLPIEKGSLLVDHQDVYRLTAEQKYTFSTVSVRGHEPT